VLAYESSHRRPAQRVQIRSQHLLVNLIYTFSESLIYIDIIMPPKGNLPIFSPCETGVPSCRHFVVIRRAEAHYKELCDLLTEIKVQVTEVGPDATTNCQTDLILNKFSLVDGAIFELERRTGKAKRGEFTERLEELKTKFKAFRDWLKL
jgi:hypothetical protein